MCVLLLRGPQTVGEIRSRTSRMFEFIDLAHVEISLQALMTHSVPLAVQLPRETGRKEARYAHLMSGEPQPMAQAPAIEEAAEAGRVDALEQEVASMRSELAELRAQFDAFRREFQ